MVVFHNDSEQPPPAYSDHGFYIRDAWLEHPNAETVQLFDYYTRPFYPDCFWTWALWYHPDTVDVSIGSRTDVKIQWSIRAAPAIPTGP